MGLMFLVSLSGQVMSENGEEHDSIHSFGEPTEESYIQAEGEEELQEISMDDPVKILDRPK